MFKDYRSVFDVLSLKAQELEIAVLGDIMLDRYYFGDVQRISPEAPVPINRVMKQKDTLGGAANVAHNLARLGCKVSLLGVAGDDENRPRLTTLLEDLAIDHDAVLSEKSRPTTSKLRVIGGHQQMLRIDFEETGDIGRETEQEILIRLKAKLEQGVRVVVISDYGKGVCSDSLCHNTIELAENYRAMTIVDPKGANWRKYQGAFIVKPNVKELAEVMHVDLYAGDEAKILLQAAQTCQKFKLENIIVTRAEYGMSIVNSLRATSIPTRAQEVFDVSGAGDTVAAVLALALAGGLDIIDAAELANLAAGVVVGKVGTYAISRDELLGQIGG